MLFLLFLPAFLLWSLLRVIRPFPTGPRVLKCGRRIQLNSTTRFCRFRRKPDWVRKEILRMKAWDPDAGCRTLADLFNRRFAGRESVGKTFVHGVLVRHQYEIWVMRRKLRARKPWPIPKNWVWAMDLTGKADSLGQVHSILGVIDHGSRMSLSLAALRTKTSIALLRHLLEVIEQYGPPRSLRTDNEPVFTSRLFRFGIWLLGIRHQRTVKGCPWMNGRVERFFGTLKAKLDRWEVDSFEQLAGALDQFRLWYNHVRPHQNLPGRTPVEAWQGRDPFTTPVQNEYRFEAWDGLLKGYYLRL